MYKKFKLDDIVGHEHAKEILKAKSCIEPSYIFYGPTGVGKTTLARAYFSNYREYSCADIKAQDIRELGGKVILNEIDCLDVKKQKMLLHMIDEKYITLIGTTVVNPNCLIKELCSRCTVIPICPPTRDEISKHIKSECKRVDLEVSEKQIDSIYSNCKNMRELDSLILNILVMRDVDKAIETYLDYSKNKSEVTSSTIMLKSAMQKSIRGSDVDASILYAMELLRNGDLEILCRRLRVIASEDIGLANPNCVCIVHDCIDNALKLGMPECRFPIAQAVAFMALQPKSNSLLRAIKNYDKIFKSDINVPEYIAYEYSKGYLYPHDYPNNWVKQEYMPSALVGRKLYEPGKNKIEEAYVKHLNSIKRSE